MENKSLHSGFCKFLDGLGNVDDGVESVLTTDAFDALMEMVESVWGEWVANETEKFFTQREDGSLVLSIENASEQFRNLFCINSPVR